MILWINRLANGLGTILLAPAGLMPDWLSNALVSIVTGLAVLVVYKYTSNQTAIAKTKNKMKANLLAIKLFKDSVRVALRSVWNILKGAMRSMFYSLRPLSVMIIPLSLLLVQMGLWYQFRPLAQGEEAVITVTLSDSARSSLPEVTLQPISAVDTVLGPVRVVSRGEVCWQVKAREPGSHMLRFSVDGVDCPKTLAIGSGRPMRVSPVRPSRDWAQMLQFPAEPPLAADSIIQSIKIDYPERPFIGPGRHAWVIFFFGVTMVVALIAGPVLKVKF